jgi:AcrR family transcriptional regulator
MQGGNGEPRRDRRRGAPVWAREPRERRGRARIADPLTRDEVVRAGLELADAEGFHAVSMRNVARRLGVGAMTLYSYVESKDDLLDLMFDEIMGELLLPEPLPGDWRTAISAIARRTREVWLRHPWLAASVGQRSSFGPNSMRHVEQSLAAVDGLGLDGRDAFTVLSAVDDFVLGHTMRQVLEEAGMHRRDGEWRRIMERYWEDMLATGEYPRLAAIAGTDWDPEHEERFERGLAWMLDGIAARYAG